MYEVFEQLLMEYNVSPADVSRATGIGKSTFSGWKSGKYNPKKDKLQKIADYFNVPVEVFWVGLDFVNTRKTMDDFKNRYKEYQEKLGVPVFDVAAGEGRCNGDHATEYEDMGNEDGAWCTVHGDSMLPELKDGDRIRVKEQTETAKTDLTVVKVDGEHATVKFVEIVENGVWLRALNKEVYEDHFFSISEVMTLPVTIIGKVVEVRRTY